MIQNIFAVPEFTPWSPFCSYDTGTGNNGENEGGGQGDTGTTGGNGGFGGNQDPGYGAAAYSGGIDVTAIEVAAGVIGAVVGLAAPAAGVGIAVQGGMLDLGVRAGGVGATAIGPTLSSDPAVAQTQIGTMFGGFATTAEDFAVESIGFAEADWRAANLLPADVARTVYLNTNLNFAHPNAPGVGPIEALLAPGGSLIGIVANPTYAPFNPIEHGGTN